MLALRLTRGAHPFVLCGRLLVAAASAGTGFLMLSALSHALAHPGAGGALLRLAWCVVPLTATVYFAVAMARNDPATRPARACPPSGSARGAGRPRRGVHRAVQPAGLGGGAPVLPAPAGRPDGAAVRRGGRRDARRGPAAAAGRRADPARDRPRRGVPRDRRGATPPRGAACPHGAADGAPTPLPVPSGLPWGVALLATGLAVESWAAGGTSRDGGVPLPGGVESGALGGVLGWLLTALGVALAGPGLTHLCGRVLQSAKPGAVRLLAGRGLQEEATRIGRPVGVVCAVASGALASATLYGAGAGTSAAGPLTALGGVLVAGCALATLLSAGVEARRSRASANAALLRLGAPASALRNAAALRAVTLIAVFVPLTWAVATLAAAPLRG